MRRYFSILVVAVATLLLSACEFATADLPDTQRANRLLWGRVEDGLRIERRHAQVVAHLNDILLGKTQIDTAYGECEVLSNRDIYTLDYSISGYSNETYRIVTDGKRLDEGGQWSIYMKLGSYMSMVEVGTAKGIEGQSNKFTIKTGNPEWYHFYEYFVAQQSEVEYSINDITGALILTMTNATGLNTDDLQNPETANYTIDYKLLKPLRFEGADIVSGIVDIRYCDVQTKSQRSLVVDITNQEASYLKIE